MGKAVLVIDMPEYCIDCPCHFAGISGMVMCGVKEEELLSDDIQTFRPDWCPLKEFPEKRQKLFKANETTADYDRFAEGWNACIDKILSESEVEE